MADQQTGGDGSVRWQFDADEVARADTRDAHTVGPNGRGRHHQSGLTQEGTIDDWITISIEVPREVGDLETYLAAVKEGDANSLWGIKRDRNGENRIYLNVRIEKANPDQVRVSWGTSQFVYRP